MAVSKSKKTAKTPAPKKAAVRAKNTTVNRFHVENEFILIAGGGFVIIVLALLLFF